MVESVKRVGNKTYELSLEVKQVAEEVMRKEGLSFGPTSIGYLVVYPYISKRVAGKCIRSGKELKFFSDCDYLVEVSGGVWAALDDELKHILVYHELLHIDIQEDDEGQYKYKIKDHDVQDFAELINRYGINWIAGIRSAVVSANELDVEDESKIKL